MQTDCATAACCAYVRKVRCPHGLHYGRIVLFTSEFYWLTERVVISMHVDATTG